MSCGSMKFCNFRKNKTGLAQIDLNSIHFELRNNVNSDSDYLNNCISDTELCTLIPWSTTSLHPTLSVVIIGFPELPLSNKVLYPQDDSKPPSVMTVVVLPTPPFWLETDQIFIINAHLWTAEFNYLCLYESNLNNQIPAIFCPHPRALSQKEKGFNDRDLNTYI